MSTGDGAEPAEPRSFPTRSVQLEGLVEVIAALLELAPDASARWVWQKLVDDYGYRGSDNSVRRYLRRLRHRSPQRFLRPSTSPGRRRSTTPRGRWCSSMAGRAAPGSSR